MGAPAEVVAREVLRRLLGSKDSLGEAVWCGLSAMTMDQMIAILADRNAVECWKALGRRLLGEAGAAATVHAIQGIAAPEPGAQDPAARERVAGVLSGGLPVSALVCMFDPSSKD